MHMHQYNTFACAQCMLVIAIGASLVHVINQLAALYGCLTRLPQLISNKAPNILHAQKCRSLFATSCMARRWYPTHLARRHGALRLWRAGGGRRGCHHGWPGPVGAVRRVRQVAGG